MNKKLTGAEKLEIVLHHHRLKAPLEFSTVGELIKHFNISPENLSQWRKRLKQRAEEIFADQRSFRETAAYETEIEQLKRRVEQMEKELQTESSDDEY